MKVLDRVDVSAWRHRCVCPTCHASLEADNHDLNFQPSSGGNQRDYQGFYFYIRCPDCGQLIEVLDTSVPPLLQASLKRKQPQ